MENLKAALILCNTNIIELQKKNDELTGLLESMKENVKKITDDGQAKSLDLCSMNIYVQELEHRIETLEQKVESFEKNNKIKVSISKPLEMDSNEKIEDISEEMEEDINKLCEDIELNEETYRPPDLRDNEELPDINDETRTAIEGLEVNLEDRNQEIDKINSNEIDISTESEKLNENIVDDVLNNK
jgi:chromosome segregation ATPase